MQLLQNSMLSFASNHNDTTVTRSISNTIKKFNKINIKNLMCIPTHGHNHVNVCNLERILVRCKPKFQTDTCWLQLQLSSSPAIHIQRGHGGFQLGQVPLIRESLATKPSNYLLNLSSFHFSTTLDFIVSLNHGSLPVLKMCSYRFDILYLKDIQRSTNGFYDKFVLSQTKKI